MKQMRSTGIRQNWLDRALEWLPCVLMAPFAIALALVVGARIAAPMELEWNEGHGLEMALRVARGEPLYPRPDAGWIPYMYGPLYYWLWGGAIALLDGNALWLGRAISVAGWIAAAGGIGWMTWRETRSPAVVGAALGLAAASFAPSGFWFDLARVDSLAVGLVVWGLALLPCQRPHDAAAAAAWFLLGLAVLAKQSMGPIALLGWGVILWRQFELGRLLVVASLLAAASLLLVMVRTGNDWFLFWAFEAPRNHASDWEPVWRGRWWSELAAPSLVPLGFIAWRLSRFRKAPVDFTEGILMGALLLSAVTGLAALAKFGGYRNNLMLFFLLAGSLAALSMSRLRGAANRRMVGGILAAMLALQIWQPWGGIKWTYSVLGQIPPAETWAEMGRLESWLQTRHESGETVLVLHHQWIGQRVGHPAGYNLDMVRVAEWAGIRPPVEALRPIANAEYDWLILDLPLDNEWLPTGMAELIRNNYVEEMNTDLAGSYLLEPVTGAPMAPRHLWRRNVVKFE